MTGYGQALWLGAVILIGLCSSAHAGTPCDDGVLPCTNGGLFDFNDCRCFCHPGTTGFLCEAFACPSGWAWSLEGRMCFSCNIGTVPSDSETSCEKCPADQSTLDRGASECVPIGVWSPWVAGTCSVTCDVGVQVRTRQCSYPSSAAQHIDCVGSDRELISCQEVECSGLSTLEIILLTLVIVIIVIIIPGGCIIIVCCRRPVQLPGPRPVPFPIR